MRRGNIARLRRLHVFAVLGAAASGALLVAVMPAAGARRSTTNQGALPLALQVPRAAATPGQTSGTACTLPDGSTYDWFHCYTPQQIRSQFDLKFRVLVEIIVGHQPLGSIILVRCPMNFIRSTFCDQGHLRTGGPALIGAGVRGGNTKLLDGIERGA